MQRQLATIARHDRIGRIEKIRILPLIPMGLDTLKQGLIYRLGKWTANQSGEQ